MKLTPLSSPVTSLHSITQWLVLLCGSYVFLGGTVSFAGWVTELPTLTDWWGTGITIKPNAALACAFAGLALVCRAFWPRLPLLSRALALVVTLLGGCTLVEHITDLDFGIDTLLFEEPPGALATAAPGRMGPPAAASFLAAGLALLFSQSELRLRGWSTGLGLAVLAIATLSLTGYLYGALALYTIPRLTGIALQTATMLAALAVGIVASLPDQEPIRTLCERGDTGRLARRLSAAAFVVPLTLGWLRLWGQRHELYDFGFGTALRTVMEIGILAGVCWWSVHAIRNREIKRLRAEAARAASDQRLQLVVEASAVPFTALSPVVDQSGTIIDFSWQYLNAAALACINRTGGDLVGTSLSKEFPDIWRDPGIFENYLAVAMRGEVREFESQLSEDVSKRWYRFIASPLDGEVAVWFADITERKSREIELREADRRKDEFLATLAHEMRNPLAPIRHAAQIAKKPSATEQQRQWCNEVIERQVQHMSLLLDDLLDVSRITRGQLQLRKQQTTLASLIASSVETAQPLLDSKGHTLNIELPQHQVLLNADPVRLAQVVSNLLNNAAKYTPGGGAIGLSAKVVDDGVLVAVSDNGIGLAPDEQVSIFNMFSQVKSSQESSDGGLGIGLALTRGLVDLHGGTIRADSPGHAQGSVFTVHLPQVVISPSRTEPAKQPSAPLTSLSILLADDNRDAAKSLAMLLELDGHGVNIAHDGEEAIRVFAATAPDVALLDIGMPRLSGHEVAAKICAANPDVVLIAITGWGQPNDRAKAAESGFDHHLTKPVDFERLAHLLSLVPCGPAPAE